MENNTSFPREILSVGLDTPRIGYKTFKQMLRVLKKANKSCEKHGMKVTYTITLPLRDPTRTKKKIKTMA